MIFKSGRKQIELYLLSQELAEDELFPLTDGRYGQVKTQMGALYALDIEHKKLFIFGARRQYFKYWQTATQ